MCYIVIKYFMLLAHNILKKQPGGRNMTYLPTPFFRYLKKYLLFFIITLAFLACADSGSDTGSNTPSVISVSINPSEVITKTGTAIINQQLTVKVNVANSAPQTIIWSIYNPGTTGNNKVSISPTGVLNVAVDTTEGIAIIRATSIHDTSKFGTCTVMAVKDCIVTTIAGSGIEGFADGQGTSAQFSGSRGIAVDNNGNIYVADSNRIRKIDTTGYVSTLAGNIVGGYADGQGTSAQFNYLCGIAVDSSGNVYVADLINLRIRKIDTTGYVTTIAGSGTEGFADGQGTSAQFGSPRGVAVDNLGNIYVADSNRIRKIDTTGYVSTLAGNIVGGDADGQGTSAQFGSHCGVAVDSSGNVYVTDLFNYRIRKIDSAGYVSTFAGGRIQGDANGPASVAQFEIPYGVAVGIDGNIYVTDNNRIRKITFVP